MSRKYKLIHQSVGKFAGEGRIIADEEIEKAGQSHLKQRWLDLKAIEPVDATPTTPTATPTATSKDEPAQVPIDVSAEDEAPPDDRSNRKKSR